ncbi:hypothetical protein PHLGIDRAFT_465409 [Phlebiopsis gigantea 11061_1 CR5-6]|uniref:Uncharacterized protein n=1 Tax=Phlebiopsis gigantea (strain 11061_1 CR5-6) TaxID=745531 RepID=A0A0C3RX40_PHLG1|nr:hypothetical protein PHLGIDRAFT_465409 [Phlebiopsis gigantea 11061_1 CR5-6]
MASSTPRLPLPSSQSRPPFSRRRRVRVPSPARPALFTLRHVTKRVTAHSDDIAAASCQRKQVCDHSRPRQCPCRQVQTTAASLTGGTFYPIVR